MTTEIPVLAISSGEPAGVGPELCAHLAARDWGARLVVLGDPALLAKRARLTGLDVQVQSFSLTAPPPGRGVMEVLPTDLAVPSVAGQVDPANASYVLHLIDGAMDGITAGLFAGMVTCPVHKGVLMDAGLPFLGHTEHLAHRAGVSRVVMMLVGGGLRVALATTHLPLGMVPAALTIPALTETLDILHQELQRKFGLAQPRIAVCGLNPHAGEGGHLGSEELMVIQPVIAAAQAKGMAVTGPWPADTLFVPARAAQHDAILAMYHDQGLGPLKYASFGAGVNVTLGLPFIRTSVDHGTALDIAGTGGADPGSLFQAVELAINLTQAQRDGAAGEAGNSSASTAS